MESSRWETFSLLRIDVPGGQGEPRASRGGKARRARGGRSSVQAHSRARTGLIPGPAAASGVGVPVLSRRVPCAQRVAGSAQGLRGAVVLRPGGVTGPLAVRTRAP